MSKRNNSINGDADQTEPVENDGTEKSESTEAKIAELEAENVRLRDQMLRSVAELENFRRRSLQERDAMAQYANESLLRQLLPVFDDFRRSVESGSQSRDFDGLLAGVTMINDKITRLLESLGVKAIPTVGTPFNVDLHEALMRQPSAQPEGMVIGELEPGYTYNDRVLRHARVMVSAGE